jgi:hypothetical protein
MFSVNGNRAAYAALPAEGAAVDHLGEFFELLFIQLPGAENLGPQAVLAPDEGLESLNFAPGINFLLALLGIDRTVFQAFAAAGAGFNLN